MTSVRAYTGTFPALYASIGVEQKVPVERAGFGIVAPEAVEAAPFEKNHCSDARSVDPGKPLDVEDVYLCCVHFLQFSSIGHASLLQRLVLSFRSSFLIRKMHFIIIIFP
jgi:hypothetical protein